MEKLYCFKLFTKSENKKVFESENVKYYKILDLIENYNNYYLKELLYYKIEEIGSITYIGEGKKWKQKKEN